MLTVSVPAMAVSRTYTRQHMFEVLNHQVSELHLIIDNNVWIVLVANTCWYWCRYCGKMNNAM